MARPSKYTSALADEICDRLIEGESLRQICESPHMPNRTTVVRWLAVNDGFASNYARARESQADLMDDMILELARNCTPETAAADRVRLLAYQWRASRLMPRKYGDKAKQGDGDKDPFAGLADAMRQITMEDYVGGGQG